MLAQVSVEAKDIVPVLTAHIYTVCPTAIPTLPRVDDGASEEQLMESLGMLRSKDGQFETFERFLARTEVSPFKVYFLPFLSSIHSCILLHHTHLAYVIIP